LVDLDVERKRHVVVDELEPVMVQQPIDVSPRTGEEIIDADDVGAFGEQPFAKMRTDKAGAASHQNARFKEHRSMTLRRLRA